jgi:Glycine/sarcosine/betaine reductase selenoprotein B (GRDB)
VVLISSAGGYLRDSQAPFDAPHPYGDYSIRIFPSGTLLNQIAIAHDHYDHQFVDADRQVLLPLRHLEDLVHEGIIGSVSPNVINFMGYLPDAARVADELVLQIVEAVYAEKAGAAFLVPLTPRAARLLPTYVLGGMLATHTLDFLNKHKRELVLASLPAGVLYVAILLLPLALSLAAGCLQQIRLSRAILRQITPSSMSQTP